MNPSVRELITIATVLANLRSRLMVLDTIEDRLVIQALRRSCGSLSEASLADIGAYLSSLDDDQLRGVASNVKGVYHELLYVYEYNEAHSWVLAELYPDTNHPGADVVYRDSSTGEVIGEAQLKASQSLPYVSQHFHRYPDVDLLATSEVAGKSCSIESTGIADADIGGDVGEQIGQLQDLTEGAQILHGAESSALVSVGLRAIEVMQGKVAMPAAVRKSVADIAIASGTTAFVSFLFS